MTQKNHYNFIKSAVDGISGFYNGLDKYNQGIYSNQNARQNAGLLELYGQNALLRGTENERAYRIKGKEVKGTQKAALVGNGIDLTSQTALDILMQTDRTIEEDALTIRTNAAEEKRQYDLQAAQARIQGYLNRRSGQAGIISGTTNLSMALLSGLYNAGYWG